MLHAEIVCQRLEREYELDLITSVPSVVYQYKKDNVLAEIQSASELPDQVDEVLEPWLKTVVITPKAYIGEVMQLYKSRRGKYLNMQYLSEGVKLDYELPMSELVTDFFDQLKSVSSGFASLDYEFIQMRPVDAVKLDILIHGTKVEAFSQLVLRNQAQGIGKVLTRKLKEVIPRQQFEVAIQATVGGTVLARETVKSFRKDVTAKLYGGDRTRRMKLLSKQKKGKKRMKQFGKMSIPQDAFRVIMQRD